LVATLGWAILNDNIDTVQTILDRKDLPEAVLTDRSCDPCFRDKGNLSYGHKIEMFGNALIFAIKKGRIEIAQTILAREDLPALMLTDVDYNGKNAFILAIDCGHPDIAKTILTRKDLPKDVLMRSVFVNEGNPVRAHEMAYKLAMDKGYTELAGMIAEKQPLTLKSKYVHSSNVQGPTSGSPAMLSKPGPVGDETHKPYKGT
jgi:ankyrin repeat protein